MRKRKPQCRYSNSGLFLRYHFWNSFKYCWVIEQDYSSTSASLAHKPMHPRVAKRSITAVSISGTAVGKAKLIQGLPSGSQVFWPKPVKVPKNSVFQPLQAPQLSLWLLRASLVFFLLPGERVLFKVRASSSGPDNLHSDRPLPPEHINMTKAQWSSVKCILPVRWVQNLEQGGPRAVAWRLTCGWGMNPVLKVSPLPGLHSMKDSQW